MRRFAAFLGVMLLVFGFVRVTSAGTITFEDLYQVTNPIELYAYGGNGQTNVAQWTHDITDDGYVPSPGAITSASLALFFEDGVGQQSLVNIGIGYQVDKVNVIELSQGTLDALSAIGIVDVKLILLRGESPLYLPGAKLTAVDPSPAPESSSMLLFGIGLIGMAVLGRPFRRRDPRKSAQKT